MQSNEPRRSPELLDDLRLRADRLRTRLEGADAPRAILLASSVNIFYLAGCVFRGYIYMARGMERPLCLVVRGGSVALPGAIALRKPEQIPGILESLGLAVPSQVGLETDALSWSETERLLNALGRPALADASALMSELRMIKTPYEVERMRIDGLHQTAAYARIPRLFREGMTDIELQVEIERVLRLEGAIGYLRVSGPRMELGMGSLIAGSNADTPAPYDFSMGGAGADPSLPVGADGTILRPGMAVMVDMNGNFNGYQTDLTRVYAVGTLPDEALRAHRLSVDMLRRLEREALPGVEIGSLARIADEMAREAGLADYFMGHRHKAGFIGHGVGIELNEKPVVMTRTRMPLREGMTLALEPKFVLPSVGAVGIENTYVATSSGLVNLTPAPEEIITLQGT